jgi:hypothetical protein
MSHPLQHAMIILYLLTVIAMVAGSAVVLINGWEDDRVFSRPHEIVWLAVVIFATGVAIWRSP